ncbi:MAG: hypothetical protein AAF919_06855 [Pseudomonadota bacterium]
MPILIAILVAIGGAIFWWARSNPRDALSVADDAITTARNAPRKIAFRRQTKAHPVEGIDDPALAVLAIGQAFLRLDGLPAREDQAKLRDMSRILWRWSDAEAEEAVSLAGWLVDQCGSASAAMSRLARRLFKIDGDQSWPELDRLLQAVASGEMSVTQQEAVGELRVALHMKAGDP